MKKIYFLFCFFIFHSIAFATTLNNQLLESFQAHTTRTIITSEKNWVIYFTGLHEKDKTEFVDSQNQFIPMDTPIDINNLYTYGFNFTSGANFDLVYSIVAINQEK